MSDTADPGKISDGYHTFDELYEHRAVLWIKLCEYMSEILTARRVWRSKLHSDGSAYDGWFILGVGEEFGEQITYHLPTAKWDDCEFAVTLENAPEFDGHTSADVLERIAEL